ncbi:hypothetical protein PIB30_029442 [Stylosanthes scabra]|uniref:F-box domain-containing protein n=1 Tax=Stylosanthes scabra TaxID=79078 RepID=A0ABU6YA01_9FABA|nr:hypothetical protein [Stylosanthes scabra]
MEETTPIVTIDEHHPPTTQRKLTSSSSISDLLHPLLLPPPENIPFDMIVTILLKLPVKSLLRMKSTCKPWNELISDPRFARDHLRASASNPNRKRFLVTYRIIFENNEAQSSLRDYPLSTVFEKPLATSAAAASPRNPFPCSENLTDFLCGSCDGMFCMATTKNCPILWNPSTGKFKQLPRVGRDNPLTFGFGYDRVSDSYKVVAMLNRGRIGKTPKFRVDHFVYTLGTDRDDDSWRKIHSLPSCFIDDNSGKFVSGTLNWLAFDGDNANLLFIISLDLSTEKYQIIMPPVAKTDEGVEFLRSAVIKESLCIVANRQNDADYWIMKEYGNADSWNLLYRIPYVGGFPKIIKFCMVPICVSDDGDEILLEYLGMLTVYNSKTGSFKASGVRFFTGSILAGVYTETLISPTLESC